jgi:hypothetical protein
MFVTQRYLAFSGWPDTKVLLAMRNIEKMEKTNTLVYIPNAISIIAADKGVYRVPFPPRFFSSCSHIQRSTSSAHSSSEINAFNW